MHERLQRALDKARPDVVVACYGMNDGIYYPFDEQRFAAYQDGINRLIEKVQASGARLILMTPPPFDPLPLRKQGKLRSVDAEKFAWFAIYACCRRRSWTPGVWVCRGPRRQGWPNWSDGANACCTPLGSAMSAICDLTWPLACRWTKLRLRPPRSTSRFPLFSRSKSSSGPVFLERGDLSPLWILILCRHLWDCQSVLKLPTSEKESDDESSLSIIGCYNGMCGLDFGYVATLHRIVAAES